MRKPEGESPPPSGPEERVMQNKPESEHGALAQVPQPARDILVAQGMEALPVGEVTREQREQIDRKEEFAWQAEVRVTLALESAFRSTRDVMDTVGRADLNEDELERERVRAILGIFSGGYHTIGKDRRGQLSRELNLLNEQIRQATGAKLAGLLLDSPITYHHVRAYTFAGGLGMPDEQGKVRKEVVRADGFHIYETMVTTVDTFLARVLGDKGTDVFAKRLSELFKDFSLQIFQGSSEETALVKSTVREKMRALGADVAKSIIVAAQSTLEATLGWIEKDVRNYQYIGVTVELPNTDEFQKTMANAVTVASEFSKRIAPPFAVEQKMLAGENLHDQDQHEWKAFQDTIVGEVIESFEKLFYGVQRRYEFYYEGVGGTHPMLDREFESIFGSEGRLSHDVGEMGHYVNQLRDWIIKFNAPTPEDMAGAFTVLEQAIHALQEIQYKEANRDGRQFQKDTIDKDLFFKEGRKVFQLQDCIWNMLANCTSEQCCRAIIAEIEKRNMALGMKMLKQLSRDDEVHQSVREWAERKLKERG